jgi:hypothetical protein
VSLVRFQFWPYFSKKNWPEKKPPVWLLSGIEVKRDAAREQAFRTTTDFSPHRLKGFQFWPHLLLPEKAVI